MRCVGPTRDLRGRNRAGEIGRAVEGLVERYSYKVLARFRGRSGDGEPQQTPGEAKRAGHVGNLASSEVQSQELTLFHFTIRLLHGDIG